MSDSTHRRDFVRSVALGASAGLLGGASARGDDPKEKKEKKEDDATKAEADARMAVIEARFGTHLDAEAKKVVRAEVEGIVRRAASLRKFALSNGDEPMPVFRPYRAPLA